MRAHLLFVGVCLVVPFLSSCARHDVVTSAAYHRIRPNMTLDEVEDIIGHKGTPARDGNVGDGFVAGPNQQVYFWHNKDGSDVSAIVVNGRVIALTDNGLN